MRKAAQAFDRQYLEQAGRQQCAQCASSVHSLPQVQERSGAQQHSLTHGAHVVPMAVPEDWSTEGFVKGLAPHIAVLDATLLKGTTEKVSINHAGAWNSCMHMPQQKGCPLLQSISQQACRDRDSQGCDLC